MTTPPQPVVRACLGLGGNVGDVREAFRFAARRLNESPGVRVVNASSIYRTGPVGPIAQDDFLNAVVVVDVTVPARELLALLLGIEREAGRDRTISPRWGPRPLDLDLLIIGVVVLREPDLIVPHPRLAERRFVLEPLAEVEPSLIVPGTGLSVDTLRERAAANGEVISRLDGAWLAS